MADASCPGARRRYFIIDSALVWCAGSNFWAMQVLQGIPNMMFLEAFS
jgi:hypothetical protein